MSRIIKGEEVQKGDKIRVVLEFTVANTTFEDDNEIRSQEHDAWIDIPEQAVIELVERPNPPIPTEMGTIIHVFPKRVTSDVVGTWMVQRDGKLVSATNNRYTREQFQRFIEDSECTFEVVA